MPASRGQYPPRWMTAAIARLPRPATRPGIVQMFEVGTATMMAAKGRGEGRSTS